MGSDFFADKKYQEMDWISQAVSPWEWDVAQKFAAIPPEVEIPPAILMDNLSELTGYRQASFCRLLNAAIGSTHDLNFLSDAGLHGHLSPLFKIKIEPDTVFDAATCTLNKPIYICKIKDQLDDTLCRDIAASTCAEAIRYGVNFYGESSEANRRAKEILDLLGQDTATTRSLKKRRSAIFNAVSVAIREDRWRIRSMALAEKLGNWIVDYINDGKLSAMANFAKFKVMTHNDQPIYSIQEVE